MSISSTNRKAGPYACNGATVAFPFAFKVFNTADVRVVLTDANEAESDLVLGTNYTVTLNADQDANPGGAVTTVATYATGNLITLTSKLENLQPVTLTNQGGFYPRVINNALDRLTILVQQVVEQVSRAVKVPISSGLTPDQLIADLYAVEANAGNSAAAAANSAANAAASAAAAAATLDNFDDRYLGQKTANPTTDNDGNALQIGALYYNTVEGVMRVYTGTGWIDAATGVNSDDVAFLAAGIGAVIRTVKDKLGESVSVKDFGAVGNGVAPDTAAVQTCLTANAGKTVLFPPGTYKLNTITVPANTFVFAYGATLDFSASDQKGVVFANGGGMFGGTVVGIGGTVFGNGTGIYAAGVDNSPSAPTYIKCPIIRDVTVRDFRYHGILFEFARHGYVDNCVVHTCGYGGIGGISVDYVNFDNNIVHDIAGAGAPDTYGVILSSWENSLTASPRSTNCAIRNNTIYNVPNWEGIDTHGGTQISITGNIVSNCRFGIAVVGGDTLGVTDRGAKDITVTGNTVIGRNDGACITVAGTNPEYASGVVVSGNTLKDGGQAGNTSSGSIRAYNCYNLTISGNSIQTPYVYGINLIQNIGACTVSGNTIVDARDNTQQYPACIAITANAVSASIFGNTFGYVSSGVGTYVSVLSISIGAALTGLDIDIGRNSFRGITSSTLTYNEATSTGVNAAGLTIARGRAQVPLTNLASCSLAVIFPERFPVSIPKIILTRAGSPVPGSVQKAAIIETYAPSAGGFGILARPYDLTTFGGSGTLEVDWVATV